MGINLILFIIAVLIIADGLFIATNPKGAKKIMVSMGKKLKTLRIIGIVEFIVGIVLFVIAIMSKNY